VPSSFKPGMTIWLLLILAVILILGNNLVFNEIMDISHKSAPMPQKFSQPLPSNRQEGQTVVRVGVVSRFAPNIIYQLYQPIMDYLNAHSEHHHELALSESYEDAALSLQQGEVQASFLGAWMCTQLSPDSGLIPVALPVNEEGLSRFHVVLITADDSPINSLSDLRGQKVAVPSNRAFSGNWLQQYGLESASLSVADLDTIQHFQHHETVIWQVLRGNFSAGVVKESLARKYKSRGLRIVAASPAIPGPPLVTCSKNQSPEVLELVQLLLGLDADNPKDRKLMQSWTPEFAFGFMPADIRFFKENFVMPATVIRSAQ
jgi:phosphonate transport system substrate-binding protein